MDPEKLVVSCLQRDASIALPSCLRTAVPLLLCTLFMCSSACAIDKCLNNGQVTYTDLSCPEGSDTEPFTGQVAPATDPVGAKQRYLADQKKLKQVVRENELEQRQSQRDAGIAARLNQQEQDKQNRCKKLDARRKAAQQNQVNNKHGNKKQIDRAKLLTQRSEDHYAQQCLEVVR